MEDVKLTREFLRFVGTRAITLVLTLGAAYLFDFVLGVTMSASLPFGTVGIALILLTKASDYQCIKALQLAGGTFYGRPPTSLALEGPYRYVRNPLYLSLFADTFGLFLIFDSPGVAVALVLQLIGVHSIIVLREENRLTKRFGDSYLQYKRVVPRWIPKRLFVQ